MKYKVLVVDDDSTLLRFLEDFLKHQGFEVVLARNGQQALRAAYEHQPDLVVLDVMMPGMDGWEVTKRLREMADLPIILITAKSAEQDKLRGFGLGVDDYITKPFSFAELSARVQAVLNRIQHHPSSGPHNVVPFGDVVLDQDRREVRRGEQSIALTPTEFRLLEVLSRRPGKAVSEKDLIEEVWGPEQAESDTVVRRYIWLLRKKIEPDPANPRLILTVRGFGYRLETEPMPPEGE